MNTGAHSPSTPDDAKVTFIVGDSVAKLSPPVSPGSDHGQPLEDNVFHSDIKHTTHAQVRTSSSSRKTTVISGGKEVVEEKRASQTSSVQRASVHIKTSAHSQGHGKVMEKFVAQAEDFSNTFLTKEIVEMSMQDETLLMPPERSRSHSRSLSPARPVVGIDHLDNLVRLMEQISKLREDNSQLKKKVSYLEDTKALLVARAQIAESRHRSTLDLADPHGFFHGKHSRAKSLISKQHLKIMQYLGSTPPKSHHSLEKTTSDISQISAQNLQKPESQPRPISPAQKLQKSRSMSVGSIEMVDLDLQTAVMELDTVKQRSSPSKSLVFRRGEFKASKKLQEKWERVKKVFGSRPEGQLGSITAEEIVKVNSKSHKRPPSLAHMASLDGTTCTQMDRLKPDDRVLSRSNPQLAEQPPHTPSSTQSEPPSCGPLANSDDEEDRFSFIDSSRNPSKKLPPPRRRSSSTSSASSLASEEIQKAFMAATLPRRGSSPTLGTPLSPDSLSPRMSRSASFKVEGSHATTSGSVSVPSTPVGEQRKQSPFRNTDAHKRAKQAWGRVKNIIHNKRDLKLKKAKSSDDREFDHEIASTLTQGSLSDSNICMDDSSESPRLPLKSPSSAGVLGSKEVPSLTSPRLSPRANTTSSQRLSPHTRSPATSPDRGKSPTGVSAGKRDSIAVAMASGSPADVMALMGVSEEYQKKMVEWENKKKKSISISKANSFAVEESSADDQSPCKEGVKYSEEFIKKMEEWEAKKGLAASPLLPHSSLEGEAAPQSAPEHSPQGTMTPTGLAENPDVTNLSESFTKRVQEWQRVKTKRSRDHSAPTDRQSRQKRRHTTVGRSSSLEHRRDRSQSVAKTDRELITKIEKKENKIRREQQKLNKMKMKLQSDVESSGESHGLSSDFVRRLREWEEMKGLSPSHLEVASLEGHHGRSSSQKESKQQRSLSRERLLSDSVLQLPSGGATIHQSSSVNNLKSKSSDSSVSMNGDSKAVKLLREKEEEISLLQDDVAQLTERINAINKEHSQEIANYRRELWASSKVGRFTIESDLMSASLRELDLQINYLQDYSQRLAKEKRHLHLRVQEETKHRHQSEVKLLEQLKNVQDAIVKSGKRSGSVSEKEVMKQLYQYLTQANEQLSELKAGLSDRSRLLEEIERHLLVQEVTNKLLVADLQRRELEVQYLRDARKKAIIRRWRTYGGSDLLDRQKIKKPILRRNNSSVLRQSFKRHSSCEELCESIHKMQESGTKSPTETSPLTSDWLQSIQSIVQKEPAEELPKENTAVQTAILPCTCPHHGLQPSVVMRDSSVATNNIPLTSVCVQTELPETHTRQSSVSSLPNEQIEHLIQQYRGEGNNKPSPNVSPVAERRPKSGSLYMEWLKKEYKPPKLELRKQVPAEREGDDIPPSPVKAETFEKLSVGDLEAKPPQMPRSPVIRSKHPRKVKTAESRLQSMYEAEGKGAWKSTPLRKVLRPRKSAGEKSPDGSVDIIVEAEVKASSDSCITSRPRRLEKQPSIDHSDAAPKRGVMSMISKYESIQKQHTSPLLPRSKAVVSQVQRLKTAEELMHDSSASRDKLASVSSDKENEKEVSKVKRMIQRFSVEESDHSQSSSRAGSQERSARSLRTTSPTSSPGSRPLKDVTNESNSQSNSPQIAIRQRTMEAKLEFLLSDHRQSSDSIAAKSSSPSPHASPLHMRSAKLSKQVATTEQSPPVWQLQERGNSSPKPVHRSSVTLPGPGAGKGAKGGKGAISALCMQTMGFGAQGPLPIAADSNSPRERKRNKFLDGYKKFFKVTKS